MDIVLVVAYSRIGRVENDLQSLAGVCRGAIKLDKQIVKCKL
jgi:hypothetical protein